MRSQGAALSNMFLSQHDPLDRQTVLHSALRVLRPLNPQQHGRLWRHDSEAHFGENLRQLRV